jgi:8-oxo-dGTP pyrophosphatase MutT (NUDIX family)
VLHLIPPPLHRAALRLAHALRKVWWRVGKPRLNGCRVLARDADGRVLLVRHCYGSGRWMLPGGGMKRGEDPLLAAERELLEEVGCRLNDPVVVMVRAEPARDRRSAVVRGRCLAR